MCHQPDRSLIIFVVIDRKLLLNMRVVSRVGFDRELFSLYRFGRKAIGNNCRPGPVKVEFLYPRGKKDGKRHR